MDHAFMSQWTMCWCHKGPCVDVTTDHVLMSQGTMCWCHNGPCVYVTMDHVLMSQGTMCWCHNGPCVDVITDHVLMSQGTMCWCHNNHVLMSQGTMCWCHNRPCVDITRTMCWCHNWPPTEQAQQPIRSANWHSNSLVWVRLMYSSMLPVDSISHQLGLFTNWISQTPWHSPIPPRPLSTPLLGAHQSGAPGGFSLQPSANCSHMFAQCLRWGNKTGHYRVVHTLTASFSHTWPISTRLPNSKGWVIMEGCTPHPSHNSTPFVINCTQLVISICWTLCFAPSGREVFAMT